MVGEKNPLSEANFNYSETKCDPLLFSCVQETDPAQIWIERESGVKRVGGGGGGGEGGRRGKGEEEKERRGKRKKRKWCGDEGTEKSSAHETRPGVCHFKNTRKRRSFVE